MSDGHVEPVSEREPGHRLVVILLLIATALGAGLRAYSVADEYLWFDEIVSTIISTQPTIADVVEMAAQLDTHPPGYYLLLHLWQRAFGSSDAAVRSLSVVLGTAAVPAIFLVGRQLFGAVTGLVAAFTMAAMPTSVLFSQEARSYTLLTLAIILMWYFAIRISRRRDRAATVGFAATALVLPWIHYWGAVALAAAVLTALALAAGDRRQRAHLLQMMPGIALATIGFVPWISVILNHQLAASETGWFPERAQLISIVGVFGRPFGNTLIMTPVGVLALATTIASFVIVLWLWRRREMKAGDPRALWWVLGMLLLPVLLMAAMAEVANFWVGIKVPNVTMIPVSVACGAAIVGLWRRRVLAGVALGLVVLFLCVAGVWRCYTETHRPDWKSVIAVVEQQGRQGDVILAIDDRWIPDLVRRYYRGPLPVVGLSREITDRGAITAEAMRVWPESGRMWLIPRNPGDSPAPEILQEIASHVERLGVHRIPLLRLDYPSEAMAAEIEP